MHILSRPDVELLLVLQSTLTAVATIAALLLGAVVARAKTEGRRIAQHAEEMSRLQRLIEGSLTDEPKPDLSRTRERLLLIDALTWYVDRLQTINAAADRH